MNVRSSFFFMTEMNGPSRRSPSASDVRARGFTRSAPSYNRLSIDQLMIPTSVAKLIDTAEGLHDRH